jgi:hypothetical protein
MLYIYIIIIKTITLITLMMEAVHTSETLVYYNEITLRYIPEGYIIFILAAVRT